MRPLVLRLGVSLLIVSVLLLLTWSLLLSAAPVRSSSSSGNVPAQSGIITDTRWLELIRSGAPGPQLSRSAAALPTLNLHLTDNLFAGRASSPAPITIVVRRSNSIIVSTSATPYPDGQSYFYAVQFYPSVASLGSGLFPSLQPGDVISLTQAGASFTMTVPPLTAQVDASADRVSGTAPVSGVVTTYLYSFVDSSGPYTQTVTVDAGGQYQADYGGTLDVRPRDNGYVAYSEAPGRTIYIRCVAPFLRAQVDGPEVSGVAAPLSSVMITVANADGTPYFYWSRYTTLDGSFEPYAYSPSGLKLKPGDRITATSAGQTFSMTVMTLTAQIDLANQQVRGNAPADQIVEVLRFGGPLCCTTNSFWNETPLEHTTVTATVTGQYTAALALARPNHGAAIVTAPDGNQTYARFAVPYLAARMGHFHWLWASYQVAGQVADVSTPVTITIQGPSGYFKDVRSVTTASDGYFADYGSAGLTLDSGDVITVTTTQGMQAALQLPLLTGQIDPVTDIVSGTAPPGARLTLTVYYYYGSITAPSVPARTPSAVTGGGGPPSSYTVIVTATAQGDYLVDLHGTLDLNDNSLGAISLTTTEGHFVTRELTVNRSQGCDYRPDLVYVGGNQVDFSSLAKCIQYTAGLVRLRDAGGHLKGEQAMPSWCWNSYFSVYFYTDTQPIAIAPGDIIEVEWSNSPQFVPTPTPTQPPWPTPSPTPYTRHAGADTHLITIVVPTLTVQLDPVANIISGQAPPSATIALNLYRNQRQLNTFTATVNAQGVYTVGLATATALETGDVAYVTYTPIERPAFSAIDVLPMLRVQLYQANVEGVLPPLSAYTATLQTTPPITTAYRGNASSEGDFNFWSVSIKPGDTVVVTTAQHVLKLSVPTLTAHVDRDSATVFGQAPPFARLRVAPYSKNNISQTVTATASGAYSATFPSLAPLNTTYGELIYFDAEGDQAILSFATVHWEVVVDDKCWNGIVDMAGAPLTATLRNNSGGLKSTLIFTPTSSSYSNCFTATIQSGDQIFLQSASATEVFMVPMLSARHNYARQAVEGAAPPDHELFAEFFGISNGTRRTFSNSSGHYGVDTSDLHPPLRSLGRVYLRDEAGNTTSAYFTVTGYQTFLPIMRR